MIINKLWIAFILACTFISANAFEYRGLYYKVNEDNPSTVYLCKGQLLRGWGSLIIPETVEYNGKQYTVTKMEEDTFGGNFESVIIPQTITAIPKRAFKYCSKLTEINLPSTIVSIDDEAFKGCNISYFKMPEKLEFIGYEAFAECKFTTISIPASVKTIESFAFYKNLNLQEVRIEDSPYDLIGDLGVFYDSPVRKAYLGRRFRINNKKDGDYYYPPFHVGEYDDHLEELTLNLSSLLSPFNLTTSSCEISSLTKLKRLYLKSSRPPQVGTKYINSRLFSQCEVIVPRGCKEKYEIDRFWGKFYKIVDGNYAATCEAQQNQSVRNVFYTIVDKLQSIISLII